MHKQRIVMLVAAALGAIACFLPWANLPIVGSLNGVGAPEGKAAIVLFTIAAALTVVGNRSVPLPAGIGAASSASGLLALVAGGWKLVDLNERISSISEQLKDNPFGAALASSVSIGVGLYLVVLAGVVVPAGWWLLRERDGEKPSPKWQSYFAAVAVAFVVLAVALPYFLKPGQRSGSADAHEASRPAQDDEPRVAAPRRPAAAPRSRVTMASYQQLTDGMTYEEAVQVLGAQGREMSRTDLAGISTVMYSWEGAGGIGANMTVMFQNNKLVSKSQFGLR
jgi:hypothetical protein